jgi:hypothetical protein
MLSGDRLLSDDGDQYLNADGDRVLDDEAGNTCCCCTCCTASCVNCTDGPTAAPSFYLAQFSGVTFDTSCISVTNMGQTTYVKYGHFAFETDVGDFVPEGYRLDAGSGCSWAFVLGDNHDALHLQYHGPEFFTWNNAFSTCDMAGGMSEERAFSIHAKFNAATIQAEVFHYFRSTTNPDSYTHDSPALSFQGTASFDGGCRQPLVIPNGLTAAGVYSSYFALDGDGNPVQCAGLGLNGSLTLTPCGEVEI